MLFEICLLSVFIAAYKGTAASIAVGTIATVASGFGIRALVNKIN